MQYLIDVCGSLGAWLLVAGPVYQGALELSDQYLDQSAITPVGSIDPQARVSPWWWLLPPVAYLIQARNKEKHSSQVIAALSPEMRDKLIVFKSKATGWLIVALGAFFIAIKETWELTQLLKWGPLAFVVSIVLMATASVLYTVVRLRINERIAHSAAE